MKYAQKISLLVALLVAGTAAWRARAQTSGDATQRSAAHSAAPQERTPAPIGPGELSGVREDIGTREDVIRFRDRVTAVLSAGGAEKGYWGVLVADADSGDVLFALNAGRYFIPASNVKLFTTVLALASLGPDFQIHTTIETAGSVDRLGVLHGDLLLVGRGDPNLSNRVFPYTKGVERAGPPEQALAEMVEQAAASGVKEILGDVIADDSYFALTRFPSGWTIDDTVWSYGAAVSAIAVNDNALTIHVKPGTRVGAPLQLSVEPWSGLYTVHNEAVTTAVKTEPQLRLVRDPESHVFHISGSLPLGTPPRALVTGVTEPAENAASLLVHLLEAHGIRVRGHSRAIHAGDTVGPSNTPRMILAEHISPTLGADVRLTNKISQNLHAELLLRVSAREKAGAVTLDDALAFAEQFRQGIGLSPDDVVLADGSGLSRNDLVTPQSIVQLLAYAQRQPWAGDFMGSLPVAGQDGTLENRMKGTAAARIRAKSGSFNHVDSLSGYATSVRGEHLIFSVFGNNIGTRTRDATAIIDAICTAMIEELGAVQQTQGHSSPGEVTGSAPGPAPELPASVLPARQP